MISKAGYPDEWPAVSLDTKMQVGFRCVRCEHPNGRWSQPGNNHERGALVLCGEFTELSRVTLPRVYDVEGGGAWLRHHLIPCDDRCTHDPEVRDHRVMTVHHLDGDKGNLKWWNLACLCQRCHLTIQGNVKMDQMYMHPHSTWFLPYVAGFYASCVDHPDLTRTEIESELAMWLAAGQPHLQAHYEERIAV